MSPVTIRLMDLAAPLVTAIYPSTIELRPRSIHTNIPNIPQSRFGAEISPLPATNLDQCGSRLVPCGSTILGKTGLSTIRNILPFMHQNAAPKVTPPAKPY